MQVKRAFLLLVSIALFVGACGGGESAIQANNDRGQLQGGGQAAGLSDNSQLDKTAGDTGSISNSDAGGGSDCTDDAEDSSGGDETVTDGDEVSGGGSNIGNQPVSQNYGSHGSKNRPVNPQHRRGVKC
jgi:hypothetical protein